jgi:hypothetical protein
MKTEQRVSALVLDLDSMKLGTLGSKYCSSPFALHLLLMGSRRKNSVGHYQVSL